MKVHANAALGPAGRLALVRDVEAGRTLRAAAAARNVAPATAHRWWHRWLGATEPQRRSGAWLLDRSSRPHRQPRRLSSAQEEPILRARRETGLGPGRLAGLPQGTLDDLEGSAPTRQRTSGAVDGSGSS
jgi:leucine-zipper of insertion element IS481